MDIENINNRISDKLSKRDYHGMYKTINNASAEYLEGELSDYNLCVDLIKHNQDLFEFMGASKQFEMAFDLQNQLRTNRNRLFLSCLGEKNELKSLFKRAVGDFSTDY